MGKLTIILAALLGIPNFTYADDASLEKRVGSDSYLVQVGESQVSKNAKRISEAFQKNVTKVGDFFDQLDRINLSISARKSVEFFDWMSFGLHYRYNVRPSYIGGYYTRMDGYETRLSVNPLQWLLEDNTPWVLKLEPKTEMHFWQHMPDVHKARNLLNGYTPFDFPISAQKAQERLKPGDLAHIRAILNVNVGYQKSWHLPANLEAKGGIVYTVRGPFDIFIFKADENKIRVRLVGRRDKIGSAGVTFGVNDQFSIFGYDVLNNKIVSYLDLDKILSYSAGISNQEVFLSDYTLNLDYPEVREAYDELFAKALKFKNAEWSSQPLLMISDPTKSREEVRDLLISNLTKLDELYRQDLVQKDHEKRRVDRNFFGSNTTEGALSRQVNFGIKGIYRLNDWTVRRDNKMAFKTMHSDGSQDTQYYFFPTWTHNHKVKALFSYIEEETLRSSNMIYVTDDQYNPLSFKSIGFYYDYTDKSYKNSEHQSVLTHFQQVLPEPIYSRLVEFLESHNLKDIDGPFKNVRVSARYFIDALGLHVAETAFKGLTANVAEGQVRQLVLDHLRSVPIPRKPNPPQSMGDIENEQPKQCSSAYDSSSPRVREYCDDIDDIAQRLAVAVNTQASPTDRHNQMNELMKNYLFRQIGPGFIFRLIPEEELDGTSHFEIRFYLNNQVEPVSFYYPENGTSTERELYETILDIQKLMSDVVPDMRLEGSIDSLTTRNTHGGGN